MRRLLAVAALAVLALVAVHRQPEAEAATNCVVPKSWGPLRAISQTQLGTPMLFAFEDEAGTVRVTPANCKPGAVVHQIDRN